MNTHSFPFDLSWTPQELADAAPLRLSEFVAFDAGDADAANAAASAPMQRDWRRRSYLQTAELPAFIRIRQ